MTPSQEQFARLQRYVSRIRRAGASDEGYDDLIAFFMHAWHFADWASNDSTVGLTLKQIQQEAKTYPALAICADIADGIKHFQLTKPSRDFARVTHKDIQVFEGSDRPATAVYTFTLPDGSTRDALALAEQIVTDWRALLARYGIGL
jgi:hypothetical protein